MADFTPIQQARRNALGAFLAMLKFEHAVLAMDYAENEGNPEAVSDEEWRELVKEIGRSRMTFVARDVGLMLEDPQKFADSMHVIIAQATQDIAEMNKGQAQ